MNERRASGFFSAVVRDSRRRDFAAPSLDSIEAAEPEVVGEPGGALQAEPNESAPAPVEFPLAVSSPMAPPAAQIRRKASPAQRTVLIANAIAGRSRSVQESTASPSIATPAPRTVMEVPGARPASWDTTESRVQETRPALPHRAKETSPQGRVAPEERRFDSPVRKRRAEGSDVPLEASPEIQAELPHAAVRARTVVPKTPGAAAAPIAPAGVEVLNSGMPSPQKPTMTDEPRAITAAVIPALLSSAAAPAAAPPAALGPSVEPPVSEAATAELAPTAHAAPAGWQPVRTVPQILPSASDLAGPSLTMSVSTSEPPGPSVHIGVVEIVVAAPAEKSAPAAAPSTPSNLSSRRYLRSL
ncbi:MAG TPA: hypothetical protein VGX68_08685 [Thermoanaerobaculia bacterium]|jgi:hypothetical protein|nr:hypothetical protein [Thermoanaerobaculia bacterium]